MRRLVEMLLQSERTRYLTAHGSQGKAHTRCLTAHGSQGRIAVLCVLMSMVAISRGRAADGDFNSVVKPFLTTHCVRCHGADEQKAERRFDLLDGRIADSNAVVDYQDILDQLNLGQMPPEDEPQPSDEERRRIVAWLTQRIRDYHASAAPSSHATVLRRLNSREYRNTVRDLLHLNMTMFHPEETFPRDQVSEHLDNVGESLVTSGYLLSQYLTAADRVVAKALHPIAKPETQTWHFTKHFRQQPEIDQVHGKTNDFSWITLYDVKHADKPEGAYGPILAFRDGVPADGYYQIRLRAEAVNRVNPYEPEFLGIDPDEPFRLGIVAGNYRVGPLHKSQTIEPQLAEFELADEEQWYEARVWLDEGYTPRFTFINGLMDVRNLYARLIRKYRDQFPEDRGKGIVADRFDAINLGYLPQIRIHEIEIKGPFFDEWPTPSQRELLGDDFQSIAAGNDLSKQVVESHLRRFASRAYRQPVTDAQIEHVLKIIQARRAEGQSPLQAFADGVKMMLCSPHFIYIAPSDDTKQTDFALASHLSYFLWSSMPDDELLQLADSRKLSDPEELRRQVDRLLDDPRSDAFITGFLDAWLNFRDLGSMPPDRDKFTEFYHYDLDAAMRQETHAFVRHLLDDNLSITNFLDSDFTFVNRPLARFYGTELPNGFGFEKVALNDKRRGGLLGQASVLTVTANGIDTSPVVRGVWLLENLLGDPPSPPPPDVEPLDPDVRGATSIRDQLEKHRNNPSCFDCHRSIDPMGFALENFDPIGGWRESYGGRVKVDASGELPGGKQFSDVQEFKSLLLDRHDQFARAMTSKLMAYALGRHLTPADRPHIDKIVNTTAERGNGFRDLMRITVLSGLFREP